MRILNELSKALQVGNVNTVIEGIQRAINEGFAPREILYEGLMDGMSIIGEKFKKNEIYIPEVLIAVRAMHAGMDILRPKLTETGVKDIGKVVIGTVKGDLHDIGKNLVKMMLEGVGFNVIDLGVDVSADKYVETVKDHQPDILAMSALLTTTMIYMKEVIEALCEAGLRNKVKIMVGGAPVTQNYAEEISADAYAKDAASAAILAKEIII